MSNPNSVLIVTMEPPAGLEEEFNDWYDTEHFPQRMSLPGFASGSRWVCLDGWPRWLAYYDLASPAALETDAYRAVSGGNSTPWSRRILPRTSGRQRIVAQGEALPPLDPAPAARLLLARYSAAGEAAARDIGAGFAEALAAHPHLIETRIYHEQAGNQVHVWAVALFRAVVHAPELAQLAGSIAGAGAGMFNLYCRYRRA